MKKSALLILYQQIQIFIQYVVSAVYTKDRNIMSKKFLSFSIIIGLILFSSIVFAEDYQDSKAVAVSSTETVTVKTTEEATATDPYTKPKPIGYGQATTTEEEPVDTGNFIKEEVKCIFKNSKKEQQCYSASVKPVVCAGTESCLVTIAYPKDKKVTWKSTCGGYGYTVMDGNAEVVEFNCLPSDSVTSTEIICRGFKYAYWQCYDGAESKSNDDSSCKPSEIWQKYAAEFCEKHCKGAKCGVNSFSISNECYSEGIAAPTATTTTQAVEPSSSSGGGGGGVSIEAELREIKTTAEKISIVPSQEAKIAIPIDKKIIICKDSCSLDGKCYPFGYRKAGRFCSDKGSFDAQLEYEAACDNSFECSSNVCVSGKCISSSLLEKAINWLKGIFG